MLVSLMDGGVATCCSAALKPSEALQKGSTRERIVMHALVLTTIGLAFRG